MLKSCKNQTKPVRKQGKKDIFIPMDAKINDFLKSLVAEGVSDLHFKAMRPPLRRIHGNLSAVPDAKPLSVSEVEGLAAAILGPQNWEKFKDTLEFDTACALPGVSRFRVSVFRQRGSVSIVMRVIPFDVPTLESLNTPEVLKKIALEERGLILVTGATGMGKSSTLAGMIEHINRNKSCHIITIEDPIEFLYRDNKSAINQREMGIDTRSFAGAFRAALRQDPDIILVGELRDTETMEIALKAAETGHLVMSTVHTTDAKETIGRFIDAFPPHQQGQVRLQLASNLKAVISQRLLERADGRGLALAAEVLIANAAIRGHILDPLKSGEIVQNMEKGREQYGSQTFDQALFDLFKQGLISEQEAVRNASSPNDFRLKITLG